jgi:uncharacterized membrane protein YkvA (DUF1232 family)
LGGTAHAPEHDGEAMKDEAMQDYARKYSDKSLWEKVRGFAVKAGREVIEKTLVLYYCFQDSDTPKWAKTVITGALGYFIVPLDAIPDITPIVGFTDDLGALAMALGIVAVHVKQLHYQQASEKLKQWFGDESRDQDQEAS